MLHWEEEGESTLEGQGDGLLKLLQFFSQSQIALGSYTWTRHDSTLNIMHSACIFYICPSSFHEVWGLYPAPPLRVVRELFKYLTIDLGR